MKGQRVYVAPQTRHVEVELEEGFMKASSFERDGGMQVSTKGHEFGNSGNYFDNDNGIEGWNDWDN